jgi:hypothetical protein
MIQDARVLQDEFIPSEVQHRDAEVNELTTALSPITRGQSGDTTFLFGPSGAGKNLHLAIRRRATARGGRRAERPVRELLGGLLPISDAVPDPRWDQRDVGFHRQSTPHDVLLDRLREYDEDRT